MFAFMGVWLILLLVAQPDCLKTFEAAKQTFIYVLTQPYSAFFYYSLLSIFVCFICGLLLFINKYPIYVMYAVFLHAAIALLIYDWSLALVIALPLTLFNKIKVNA